MHHFCFNDCIPNNSDESTLTSCLAKTLREYNELFKTNPNDIDGIVTAKHSSELKLNTGGTLLKDCITSMENKSLRTFAYSIFNKHPVAFFYPIVDDDDLLDSEYVIDIAGTNHTAINHVITAVNDGILFTLALHDDLKKNTLIVSSNSARTVTVNNLYGIEVNTAFIRNYINAANVGKLGNYEKLLALIGTNIASPRFSAGFNSLSLAMQISVLKHIEEAIGRKGNSNLFADGDLIKDVTPDKFPYKVFELRIFKPVAYRLYFYETANKVYLALIEKKPPPKTQNNQIDASASIIKQLILLGN